MIDVWGKSSCVQCDATYRALKSRGLNEGEHWQRHDLTAPENAATLQWVMDDLNYTQAPVVFVDDDNHWCGFRPDKIATLTPGESP